MAFKLTAEQSDKASKTLARIDQIAQDIQNNYKQWGMPFEAARQVVNALDESADEFEKLAFGDESFARRQAEVIDETMSKEAKVIKKDSDEPYMSTYNAPMAPHQTDGDEPYMSAYKDDQSSAVASGKSETGRALAP